MDLSNLTYKLPSATLAKVQPNYSIHSCFVTKGNLGVENKLLIVDVKGLFIDTGRWQISQAVTDDHIIIDMFILRSHLDCVD